MIKWPEIQYREAEDGILYPIIDFPKQPAGDIGKYGRMRKDYLEKHRPVAYRMMVLEGTFNLNNRNIVGGRSIGNYILYISADRIADLMLKIIRKSIIIATYCEI